MARDKGIDYSRGMANIDKDTGIRYGVIHHGDVGQTLYEALEGEYGPPTCPKCGNECQSTDNLNDELFEDYLTGGELPEGYTEEQYDDCEYYCEICKHFFGNENAFSDPIAYVYERGGYALSQSYDDPDVWVLKSPYFTYSQFCSPCAPGAGYLKNAFENTFDSVDKDGNPISGINPAEDYPTDYKLKAELAGFPKVYCLHHDWFEPEQTGGMVTCKYCNGTGIRQARDLPEITVSRLREDGYLSDEKQTITCWVCLGTGERVEYVRRAPYPVFSVDTGEIMLPSMEE